MSTILDRPIWTALTTRQAHLGDVRGLARRYRPDILPFAATQSDDPRELADLVGLMQPGETALVLSGEPVVSVKGCDVLSTASVVQMIAVNVPDVAPDEAIVALTQKDVEEMLALATLTKPGPFSLKSLELGRFWGVREGGRIVAMAGERMKQPGFTELSGVCTHPDHRGKGYTRRLSLHVAELIKAAGDRSYLHVYAGNRSAIRLYETIGFALRGTMHLSALRKLAG